MYGQGSANSKGIKLTEIEEEKKISALIVDDCRTIRMMHKALLMGLEIEAVSVEDGKEAINLHHSGASFDLILMDMKMPVMDGPTATRELRAMGVKSVIVGVTSATEIEAKEFMEAGLNYCIEKPVNFQNLEMIVQELKGNDNGNGNDNDN